MSRLFLSLWISVGMIITVFFPIVTEVDGYFDIRQNKYVFSVNLFRILPVFGGYFTAYDGGFALHFSKNTAILFPYKGLKAESKKFSIVRSFHLLSVSLITESGAEYMLGVSSMHTVIDTFFRIMKAKSNTVCLWLTDGDKLSVAARVVFYFSIFTFIKQFVAFIGGKLEKLWKRKMQKSTT